MIQLTKHFSVEEFTVSETAARKGIDNQLPMELLNNAARTCELLEEAREILGNKAIIITSGYRCPALNGNVPGSSKKSAHMQALAADFICPGFGTPYRIVEKLQHELDGYDQLIYEGTWVHLGLAESGVAPRREVLTARFERGVFGTKVQYVRGLIA